MKQSTVSLLLVTCAVLCCQRPGLASPKKQRRGKACMGASATGPTVAVARGLKLRFVSARKAVVLRGECVVRRVTFPRPVAAVAAHPKSAIVFVWGVDQDMADLVDKIDLGGAPSSVMEPSLMLLDTGSGRRRTLKHGLGASFSPGGRHVALLQGQFGPIRILRVRDLPRLFRGLRVKVRVVGAPYDRKNPTMDPAKHTSLGRWESPGKLSFSGGCCGSTFDYLYQLKSGKLLLTGVCHGGERGKCHKRKAPAKNIYRSPVRWWAR